MFRNYLVVQAKGTFFTTPYSSEPANTVLKVCSSLAKSTKGFHTLFCDHPLYKCFKGFSKYICGHKNNLTLMISTSNL